MAHRSGGGSHSGGHHSSSHHSGHGGRSSGPRYSKRPFPNARRFRYYDRHGRENYIYCSDVPRKSSIFALIVNLIFFIPFIGAGLITLVFFLISFLPPHSLEPVFDQTDVHIIDEAGVIDNEVSLEDALQEFEDLTGISPYVMTVYDSEWIRYFDNLSDYAYSMYLNTFSDEQHFLVVYSEPENAEELDFVNWSWEAIQGDETDRILTEDHFDKFSSDLHDDLLRDSVSVGEAFENAFKNSLTYMMKGDRGESASIGIFSLFWNFFIGIAIFSLINDFIKGRREYQEVPYENTGNAVSGAMGYGNNIPYQGNEGYQNNTTFQGGGNYQNNTTFQGDGNYQNSINYGANEFHQSSLNGVQYNGVQYNAQGQADDNFYNDDARFRSPEYYDDDARYRGSTAYESDKNK